MKKLLTLLLAAALFITAFPVTAFAESRMEANESQPSVYLSMNGAVNFVLYSPETTSYYDGRYGGATYDEAVNTLFLDDLSYDYEIEAYNMGDDFTVDVSGDCWLGALKAYGIAKSTSLNINGNGTLTVNKELDFDTAITVDSIGNGTINFGKNVTVYAYGDEDKFGKTQAIAATNDSAEPNGFTFGNGKTYDYSTSREAYNKPVQTPSLVRKGDWGLLLKNPSDPEGEYAAIIDEDYYDSEADKFMVNYLIKKCSYSEHYKYYTFDESYDSPGFSAPEADWEALKNEVAKYGFELQMESLERYEEFMIEKIFTRTFKIIKAKDDPTKIFGRWYEFGNYLEELEWDDDLEMYKSIDTVWYEPDEFEEKYEIVYTDEQEYLPQKYNVWSSKEDYPNGNYDYQNIVQSKETGKLFAVSLGGVSYYLNEVTLAEEGDDAYYYLTPDGESDIFDLYGDEALEAFEEQYSYLREWQYLPETLEGYYYSINVYKDGRVLTNSDYPGKLFAVMDYDEDGELDTIYRLELSEEDDYQKYNGVDPIKVNEADIEAMNYEYAYIEQPIPKHFTTVKPGYSYLYEDSDGNLYCADYEGLVFDCDVNDTVEVNGESYCVTVNYKWHNYAEEGYEGYVMVEELNLTPVTEYIRDRYVYSIDGGYFEYIGEEAPENATGDVNGDGVVDILDASMIQKYSVDKIELTPMQLFAADVNDDGAVDVLDATDIQKYSVDKIPGFKKAEA